jgi:hypothetical protein
MKTNNFFDPERFFGLLKQDILFNYKFYLSFLVGLGIGIYVFSYLLIRNANLSSPSFVLPQPYPFVYLNLQNILLGAMTIFIGMSFPAFRKQTSTSYYLLTPGSAFEKILVQFIVRFVLFIPLVLILLRLGIFLAIASMLPDPERGFDPLFEDNFSFSWFFIQSGFLSSPLRYLAWLFLFFAGSVFSGRYAVIKTLGITLALPIALFLIIYLTGGKINWLKIYTDYLIGNNFFLKLITPGFMGILLISLPWTYFKLKEKEL